MLRALLIDDETSARIDLREKLALHHEVAVVGEAATLAAARALLAGADYDLVFLDAQLSGGDSFQLAPFVRSGASIIIATAHARHAVRAFEHHAVDYLLKPIDAVRLAEALRRAAAARPSDSAEVALSPEDRAFLRQMVETWEDSLHPTHVLRRERAATRLVRYARNQEPTRLFLASARVSIFQRCWRAFRAAFDGSR